MKSKGGRSSLRKNIFREIWNTKSRFMAIFAIVGISVGFFSGLKSAAPSIMETGREYFRDQHLMDIRLLSTVGFDEEDIKAIDDMAGVEQVMPSYASDLLITQNSLDSVVRAMALPTTGATNHDRLNDPVLIEGRLPKGEGECVIENYYLKMSGYQIGDTITLNPNIGDHRTTDIVRHLSYQIVGVVESPLYLTYLRGNTNIGDGTISFYIMLPPEEFVTERYTVIYATTKASAGNLSPFEESYKDLVKEEQKQLESLSEECVERFRQTTYADAVRKLTDAQKEFDEKKSETLQKLGDGEKQLVEGQEELFSKTAKAQQDLDQGESELSEARDKLSQGQTDYSEGIEAAKKKLTDAETQYREGLAEYNAAKTEYENAIDAAEREYQNAKDTYDKEYLVFYSSTKPSSETKLTLMKTAIDTCQEMIDKIEARLEELRQSEILGDTIKQEIAEKEAKLEEYRAKLQEYQDQYDESMALLAEGEQKLTEAKELLDAAETELTAKKAENAVKLNEAKTKLDQAEGELENGRLEYQTALATGILELQSAQTKISEADSKLSAGRQEMADKQQEGMQQLKEAREKLAEGRYEAHVKLGDAEIQLKDARNQVDSLDDARWIVYTRDDNVGYSGLVEDADRVDSVAKVFPVFFLLIAALVCFTTMARMVEERRTETGTLKALGYSNGAIALKYLVYSGMAALTGSIVGSVAGVLTLPIIIVDTYGIMYTLPETVLSVDWMSLSVSSVAGIVLIMTVSFFACYRDLRLSPATLMRPKAPKPGKRILLEHIRPIWNHMGFTSKVTARNLFRYKARFFMTVVGVAGCTALMVAAMGLKDSVTGIAEKQFVNLTKYQQVYALSEAGSAQENAYLLSKFHQDDRFQEVLLSHLAWGNVSSEQSSHTLNARMIIGEDRESFEKMFILRDRVSHEPVVLNDQGVVIDERGSMVLDVKVGDHITVTIDEVKYSCPITGITENYAGNYVYMTPSYFRELTGKDISYSVIFTVLQEDTKAMERETANDYMALDEIVTVSAVNDQIQTMLDMMSSLDFIIFVMILCAGMLAVVVLYNLTNINIAERVREIATIKVLGFYNLETANFIYRESIALTLVGSAAGLLLGDFFAEFIVQAIQMDNVMFPKGVSWLSYLLGFLLTIAFSLIVNFMMYFKMNKISMVESLKSIE